MYRNSEGQCTRTLLIVKDHTSLIVHDVTTPDEVDCRCDRGRTAPLIKDAEVGRSVIYWRVVLESIVSRVVSCVLSSQPSQTIRNHAASMFIFPSYMVTQCGQYLTWACTYISDLVPVLVGPSFSRKLMIPLPLLFRRKRRIRHLTPSPKGKFHSFQQSMYVQGTITSSFRFRSGREIESLE